MEDNINLDALTPTFVLVFGGSKAESHFWKNEFEMSVPPYISVNTYNPSPNPSLGIYIPKNTIVVLVGTCIFLKDFDNILRWLRRRVECFIIDMTREGEVTIPSVRIERVLYRRLGERSKRGY